MVLYEALAFAGDTRNVFRKCARWCDRGGLFVMQLVISMSGDILCVASVVAGLVRLIFAMFISTWVVR